MHAYWVVGDGFFYTTGKIWKKRYRGDFLGPAATDVDPAERAAILEAIEKMGNSAPDAAIEIR